MDTKKDIELFRESFLKLIALCEGRSSNDKELSQLFASFEEVATISDKFDFEDIKFNGYRTAIYAAAKLMRVCVDERPRDADHVLRLLNYYVTSLTNCHSVFPDSVYFLKLSSDSYFRLIKDLQLMLNDLKNVIGPYSGRLFAKPSEQFYKTFPFFVTLLSSSSFSGICKRIVNRKFRNRKIAEASVTNEEDNLTRLFRLADKKLIRKSVRVQHKFKFWGVRAKTLKVQITSEFELKVVAEPSVDVVIERAVDRLAEPELRTVRCRLYENTSVPRDSRRHLIFHVHGGGFVGGSPDSHEIYLREYSKQIPEAAILSVDYRLAPEDRFPAATQDVLDIYLWAMSGSTEVSRRLGFLPDKVIWTGDSGGVTILMGALFAMVQIRSKWPDSDLPPLPSSLVSIYGAFAVLLAYYPSQMFTMFDVLISPWCLKYSWTNYSPFNIQPDDWRANEVPISKEIRKQFVLQRNPFWSPIYYKSFDELSDVKLIAITTTVDSFGDTSVIMSRAWRGPVSMVVVDREPHGFLQLHGLSASATAAVNLCIEKIRSCL